MSGLIGAKVIFVGFIDIVPYLGCATVISFVVYTKLEFATGFVYQYSIQNKFCSNIISALSQAVSPLNVRIFYSVKWFIFLVICSLEIIKN